MPRSPRASRPTNPTPAANAAARPLCFVAMPFGDKAPPGKRKPVIAFNTVHAFLARAVAEEGMESVRADFETTGGFVHRAMYERLIVAEYVVADVTFANPNVMYEIGIRQGCTARPTILVGEGGFLRDLPFDFRPLRVIPYSLGPRGRLAGAGGEALVTAVRERIRSFREGGVVDNPLAQVTQWAPQRGLPHDKADVLLQRMKFAGELGRRIDDAVLLEDAAKAVERLAAVEREALAGPEVVAQLHTTLLGVYVGYREKKAYGRMVDLFARLPAELRRTPIAVEQFAFALNRLSEQSEEAGDREAAADLRSRALRALDEIPESGVTSETHGIRGRVYKAWYEAERKSGAPAKAAAYLATAIRVYEDGVRADMRDSYPGVNAVTLRRRRATTEDLITLQSLVPVVRFAADNAPRPRNNNERYWQSATKLELAVIALDWPAARARRDELLGIPKVQRWMFENTCATLQQLRDAPHQEASRDEIDALVGSLRR